jgi:hypothetical protein
MEWSYIIFSVVRLGLLLFSLLMLPSSLVMLKTAWQTNDHKKMRKAATLLWGAILAGCLFIKMFVGMSCVY